MEQSSTFDSTGIAKNAVDGCTKTIYGQGCCSHTLFSRDDVWFRVDLERAALVMEVSGFRESSSCHGGKISI